MSRARAVTRKDLNSYRVVRMSEHDLLEVVEIEEVCALSLWGWDAYRAELDRPESIMLIARSTGGGDSSGKSLYGFIAARVSADELHINNLGVRASARRGGVGGALLDEALRRSARKGAAEAVLEVRAGNRAAQELYRHHGFRLVGRRRNYYRDPIEDAFVMWAALKPLA